MCTWVFSVPGTGCCYTINDDLDSTIKAKGLFLLHSTGKGEEDYASVGT